MMKRNIKIITILVTLVVLLSMSNIFPAAMIINESTNEQIKPVSICDTKTSATVYFRQYDRSQYKMVEEPIGILTIDQAYALRDQLLAIEEKYDSSREKIEAQITLLSNWQVLPETFSYETYQQQMDMLTGFSSLKPQTSSVSPNVIICGPSIASFLTVGGPIIPLHVLLFDILKPFWYNTSLFEFDAVNGVLISTFLGILPVVAFYCTATTLINAYGAVLGEHTVISPFIALMLLHVGAGLSIAVNDNGFPVNIFDWAIGLSATGLIAYIDIA